MTAHVCVCISLCTTVVQHTAQSSSDYLPSYPPDKHHSSVVVVVVVVVERTD